MMFLLIFLLPITDAKAAEYQSCEWLDMHVTLNVENTSTPEDDVANLILVCDDNGENCEWIINY